MTLPETVDMWVSESDPDTVAVAINGETEYLTSEEAEKMADGLLLLAGEAA